MHLTFEINLEDAVALGRSIQASSPTLKQHRRVARWAFPALPLVLLVWVGLVTGEVLYYVFAPIVSAGFFIFSGRLYDSGMRWQLRRIYREQETLTGLRTMAIREEGLETSGPLGAGILKWTAITRIEETDERVFLHLGNLTGIVVARSRVREGDYDGFVAELKRRHAAHPA